MAERKIVVAAHGHCFDGLVSAAMFTHLRRHLGGERLAFRYLSCGYGPNLQTIPERWLKGHENAIVDFRFTPSPRLSWYFDHHVTAFSSAAERDQALGGSDRYYFDAGYGSCTKLIADVGRRRYGASFDAYAPLIEWADRIDRASFPTPAEAIDRSRPVMQLGAVIEQHGDGALYDLLVPRLLAEPVDEVAGSEPVQQRWRPIGAQREATLRRVAQGLERRGEVVFVDLHDAPLEASGKFVAYALVPDCMYSVALVRMKQHFKILVGYNPWCGKERRHDIAELCRRFGGGGHPVVGATTVPLAALDRARELATAITDALNGEQDA